MNAQIFGFTEYFLNQIEQSNKEKPDAPLALVIQGEYDDKQVLCSQVSFHNILEISKTHQVAIRVIGSKSLWSPAIQQTSENYQKDINLLYVIMHGNGERLRCGKEEFLTTSDFQEEDFSFLSPVAIIMLVACKAGIIFAPHIAKLSQRTVLACKDNIDPVRTLFVGSLNPSQLLCFDESNNLLTEAYFPNGQSKPLSIHEKLKEQLFSEKFEYLNALASKGDPLAEIDLADMYQKGIHVDPSDERAFYYYAKAANQGVLQAQITLADFYRSGVKGVSQSNELALYWLTKAAHQGHPLAQYETGRLYHLAPPTIVQSDETALYWYSKASEQNQIAAWFAIGIFYEEGRGGLAQSDENALSYYRAAAKAKYPEALYMMAIFYQEGRGGLTTSKEKSLRYYQYLAKSQKIERLQRKIEALKTTKLPSLNI